jgi:hypothetical protein
VFSSKVHSGPGPNVMATPPTVYTFKGIAGVDTESTVKGASGAGSQQTQLSGTYTVREYTLSLAGSGENEQHIIFPAPRGNLNIDGTVFKKQPQ